MAGNFNFSRLLGDIDLAATQNVAQFNKDRQGVRDDRRQRGIDEANAITQELQQKQLNLDIAQKERDAAVEANKSEQIRQQAIGLDVGRVMTTFLTLKGGTFADRDDDEVDGFKEFLNIAKSKIASPGLTDEQKKPWQKAVNVFEAGDPQQLRDLATGHFQNIDSLIANAPELVPDLINKRERRETRRKEKITAEKPVSVARTSRLVNPVTGAEIVGAEETPAKKATFAQQQSLIKGASRLPSIEAANQFLTEQASAFPELFPVTPSFKDSGEFIRAKGAFKGAATGTRMEIGPNGQIIITTGVDPNKPTIARTGKEQGMLAQDRALLSQIEDIETQISELVKPEAAFGVTGSVLDSTIVGVLNQLPITQEMTVSAISTALGDRVSADEIPKIKAVRSSMALLRRGMMAVATGVQGDSRASKNEFNLAQQIVRGLEAKDDFKTVQRMLPNIKRLINIRTQSQTISQRPQDEQKIGRFTVRQK